jgi:hypothetical protein
MTATATVTVVSAHMSERVAKILRDMGATAPFAPVRGVQEWVVDNRAVGTGAAFGVVRVSTRTGKLVDYSIRFENGTDLWQGHTVHNLRAAAVRFVAAQARVA